MCKSKEVEQEAANTSFSEGANAGNTADGTGASYVTIGSAQSFSEGANAGNTADLNGLNPEAVITIQDVSLNYEGKTVDGTMHLTGESAASAAAASSVDLD